MSQVTSSQVMRLARLCVGLLYILFIFVSPTKISKGAFMVADAAAFCLLVSASMEGKTAMPLISAVWLVINYLTGVKKDNPSWLGFDGFAGATLIGPMTSAIVS